MATKRQLNSTKNISTKRYLKEKIKGLKEFIEQSNHENTQNLTDANTNKEILINQLRDYRKKVQEFKTTLTENEETEALINNYEDVYIEREKLALDYKETQPTKTNSKR